MNWRNIPHPRSTSRIEAGLEAEVDAWLVKIRRRIVRQVLPKLPEIVGNLSGKTDAAEYLNIGGIAFDLGEGMPIDYAEQVLFPFALQTAQNAARSIGDQISEAAPAHKKHRLKGLGLYSLEPWMKTRAAQWASSNASLISNLPEWTAQQTSKLIRSGVNAGKRWETIAAELESTLEAPPWRLRLIARDQVGKLQSNIIAERQRELGINRYFWGTANDRRVVGRPGGLYPKGSAKHQDHWVRRGLLFVSGVLPLVELVGADLKHVVHSDWTDGHPGEGINCRCVQLPDLRAIL